MKNIIRLLYGGTACVITCIVFICFGTGCKKTMKSNSTYKDAYLFLSKTKRIFRNGSGMDSVSNSYSIGAYFGDGSTADVRQWKVSVGSVWLGPIQLAGPDISLHSTPYYYAESNASEASVSRLDKPEWKVISPNGVTDIVFDMGNMEYYRDTMPYVIDRAQGLSIRMNNSVMPNADSVRINIVWADNNEEIDTMVSANAGDITFSPQRLSVYTADSNWYHEIFINASKFFTVSMNGRNYKFALGKQTIYNVNVK